MELKSIVSRSLCRHCIYRMSRVVSTEGLALDSEAEKFLGSNLDENSDSFIHEACTKLAVDLDHIVLDCSCFEFKDKNLS